MIYHGVRKYGLTMCLLTKVKQAPVKHRDEIVVSWKNFTVNDIEINVVEAHSTIARINFNKLRKNQTMGYG